MHWAILRQALGEVPVPTAFMTWASAGCCWPLRWQQARRQVVPQADLIAYLKHVNQTPECGKQAPLDSR